MTSETRPQFRFGPSKRYLPGKKLKVGDVLTMNILDVPGDWKEEPEESQIDTDYGSKWEFPLIILSSSTSDVKVGMVTWRTVCHQAKELVLAVRKWDIDLVKHGSWVYRLTVTETGYDLEEVA